MDQIHSPTNSPIIWISNNPSFCSFSTQHQQKLQLIQIPIWINPRICSELIREFVFNPSFCCFWPLTATKTPINSQNQWQKLRLIPINWNNSVKVQLKTHLLSHSKQPFPFSLFSSFLDFQICFFCLVLCSFSGFDAATLFDIVPIKRQEQKQVEMCLYWC